MTAELKRHALATRQRIGAYRTSRCQTASECDLVEIRAAHQRLPDVRAAGHYLEDVRWRAGLETVLWSLSAAEGAYSVGFATMLSRTPAQDRASMTTAQSDS